jgi:hypothetical protein
MWSHVEGHVLKHRVPQRDPGAFWDLRQERRMSLHWGFPSVPIITVPVFLLRYQTP